MSATDPSQFAAVKSAVLSRIANRRIYSKFNSALPKVSVVKADFSIRQLAVWRDSIVGARKALRWTMVDLDEGRNRVSIGVASGIDFSERSSFALEVARLGIPWHSLNVFAMEGARPTSAKKLRSSTPAHLRDKADSLAGGYQIYWNNVGGWSRCTIGFVASISDGTKGFISAGHCSQSKWDTDTTSMAQPNNNYVPPVAREAWDMQPGTCPFFWSCNHYRYSDANLSLVDTTVRKVKVGYLARPSTRSLNSGTDTTISNVNPYIEVVGETSSIVQGSDIDQIGAVSGWTYSEVLHTCVTWDDFPYPFNQRTGIALFLHRGK
ncbi:hypothetical protein [Gemmatimonas sp.]|uniref:hypothetical protein n=1 Tax=Gemmatimonas sp. TaxID=1962908 RepID=UPI00286DEBF8|nr:hypothetical protein [Gemmatimonas sp.]